jgi:biotin carboxyl carrier protein
MELEVAGRRRSVDVRQVDGGSVVTIDGRSVFVSAVQAGERWSVLVGDADVVTAGAPGLRSLRSYDVRIGRRAPGEVAVAVDGAVVTVGLAGRMARSTRPGAGAAAGSNAIVAPMPGRIVKVLVKAGDVVSAHQPVIVVEAMKMENELRAPRGGTVVDVRVVEGLLVEAKTVLLVVEGAEALPQGS